MRWFKGLILNILPEPLPCTAAFEQVAIIKSSNNACFYKTIATRVDHVDPGMQDLLVALGQSAIESIKGLKVSALGMNLPAEHSLRSRSNRLGQ